MQKLKIIVCAHKADSRIRNYAPYVPVHGGKALHPDMDLGFIGDDTGDNISEKNPFYSEWSVIYLRISLKWYRCSGRMVPCGAEAWYRSYRSDGTGTKSPICTLSKGAVRKIPQGTLR